MTEQIFIISDASKLLEVEPHVLRNWECELKLPIKRNELGHRFYTQKDISTLQMIKKLKEHGFSLKHIKLLLPAIDKLEKLSSKDLCRLREKLCLNFAEPENIKESTKILYTPETTVTSVEKTVSNDKNAKKEELKAMLNDVFREIISENLKQLFMENYNLMKKDLLETIKTKI